jgi:hypothetical protein
MSNNSYPCRAGGEIGRAQAAQAWACGLEPEPVMNSILLKPNSDGSSQVIVNGQVWKNLSARDYYGHHPELLVAASGRGFGRNAEAVLIVQMDVLGVRKHPEAGTLGTLLPDVATFVEQRSIAAELVYREGAQQSTFFGGQQIDGPDGAFHD